MTGRAARQVVQSTTRLLNIPARLYACVYTTLRLNKVFHGIGCPPSVQLYLLPRRLEVNRRLMNQPYWVAVSDIKWGGRPAGGESRKGDGLGAGLVLSGDWDIEDRREIDAYLSTYIYSKAVYQIWRDGGRYEETDQFKEMTEFVSRGLFSEWQSRGCRSLSDVHRYFAGLEATFLSIKKNGYRSQRQLGSTDWSDEIKVFVGRNGELLKLQGAGHHRLAMARILNVAMVPVVVIGMHRDWALRVQQSTGKDVLSSADAALQRLGENPDTEGHGRS